MRVFVGILFIFVMSLIASFIIYFFLVRQKPKVKRRIKPLVKARQKTTAVKKPPQILSSQTQTRHRYELPPGVPRDINTIRIIAQEEPQIIIDIIRKWMKER